MSFIKTEIIVHVLYKYLNILLLPRSFIKTEIIVCVLNNYLISYFCFHQGNQFFSNTQIHISQIYVFHTIFFHKHKYAYIWFLINICLSHIYTIVFHKHKYAYVWFLIQDMHVCEVRLTIIRNTICTIHVSNVHVSNKYIYIYIYIYLYIYI